MCTFRNSFAPCSAKFRYSTKRAGESRCPFHQSESHSCSTKITSVSFAAFHADVSRHNLIVQPRNRGTAPAILYSLLQLAEIGSARLGTFDAFRPPRRRRSGAYQYVDLAFAAVEEHPHLTVLVGIAPDEPETAYRLDRTGGGDGYGAVQDPSGASFLGKALSRSRARTHGDRLSLEYSHDGGSPADASWLVHPHHAGIVRLVFEDQAEPWNSLRGRDRRRVIQDLRPSDFSRRVLESAAPILSVLPVSNVGWSDLGEPHRVAKALARPRWSAKTGSRVIISREVEAL